MPVGRGALRAASPEAMRMAGAMWAPESELALQEMSVVRSNFTEIENESMLTALLSETAVSMLKIGKALQKVPVTALDRWEDNKELADMPSNERIGQLLDIPELPPLVEFMGIFDSPVDIVMESDRAWPPPHAQPY